MFLFPESPIPSPQDMRRQLTQHFLHQRTEDYDLEEMMEDMKVMEQEYREWKSEVKAKMRQYEQFFTDYEYVLNKLLIDQQTKKDS